MFRFLSFGILCLFLGSCSSLPVPSAPTQGIVILPLAFRNTSNLSTSLVDLAVHFNNGVAPLKFEPRNGYLVVVAAEEDLRVVGISMEPKERVSGNSLGKVSSFDLPLTVVPGQVTVSPFGIMVDQTQGDTERSYQTSWNQYSVSSEEESSLLAVLRKDGNAKAWRFPEEAPAP